MEKKKIYSIKFGDDVNVPDSVKPVFEKDQVNHYFEIFKNESDRGSVLTAVTIIDDLLKKHIENIFNKGKESVINDLFEFNGPFSTFSSKIDVLYCYGRLSEDDRYDLHMIRKLRNYVAHSWGEFVFNDEIEKKYLDLFRNYFVLPGELAGPYEPRTKFLLVCARYLLVLSIKHDAA